MADDIVLDAGDTRYESITGTDGATPPNPIDFTDATNVVWTATLNGNVYCGSTPLIMGFK